jgi:fibronectin-binding autotransporter adhesin
LGPGASLGNSSLIRLAAGTTLDATLPGLTLGTGQTLAGSGTVIGNVTNNSSTLSPGTSAGTITISGDLTMANSTNVIELGGDPFTIGSGVNDLIVVNGFLNLSGVSKIKIVPAAPLSTVSPYTVAVYGVGLNGTAANLQVISDNPRYTFSLVDPATTLPYIQVSVSGNPTPLIWKGGKLPNVTAWDHSVTNWFNTGLGQFDRFYNGDLVTFDDTSVTNLVTVTETNLAGLTTFANNSVNYTLNGSGILGGIVDKSGNGTVTLAISNVAGLAMTFITNNAGTIAFNMASNAVLAGSVSDNNFVGGTLVNLGPNLILGGDNFAFNGPIIAGAGTLSVTNNNALGSISSGTTVSNNSRLYLLNGVTVAEALTLSGNFAGNGGALQAGGGTITASGAITLGSATRIQVDTNSTLNLQGGIAAASGSLTIASIGNTTISGGTLDGLGSNSLIKTNTGQLAISADSFAYNGAITVDAGVLRVSSSYALGTSAGGTVVKSNTTLDFFFNAPIVDEPITIAGSGTANQGAIHTGGGGGCTPALLGPISLSGDALIKMDGGTILSLSNNITGNASLAVTIDGNGPCLVEGNVALGGGSLLKMSSGQLILNGAANSWSGSTLLIGGSIALGPSATLGGSTLVAIGTNQGGSGTFLEASASSPVILGSGQTLAGYGTIRGSVTLNSGAVLSPGFGGAVGTLTITNALVLNSGMTYAAEFGKSGSLSNDMVSSASVQIAGTLSLTDLGPNPLAPGDSLKLFQASSYTGSFSSIIPATPGPGLVWDTTSLTVDGTLKVGGSPAPPTIDDVFVSGGNIVMSGSGGTAGANYSVLTETNLATVKSNWTLLGTGTFGAGGTFSVTNSVSGPRRFYLIRVP